MPIKFETHVARFSASFVVNQRTGCHEFTGALNADGYGECVMLGERLAHRVAYRLANKLKIIPGNKVVRHKCDNRKCINAEHLQLGTRYDNFQDAVGKATMGQHSRVLTIAEQKEIRTRRRAGERGVDLAAEFGVSQQTVCDIKHGRHGRYQ